MTFNLSTDIIASGSPSGERTPYKRNSKAETSGRKPVGKALRNSVGTVLEGESVGTVLEKFLETAKQFTTIFSMLFQCSKLSMLFQCCFSLFNRFSP